MTCQDCRSILDNFDPENVSEHLSRLVFEHLQSCPFCDEYNAKEAGLADPTGKFAS